MRNGQGVRTHNGASFGWCRFQGGPGSRTVCWLIALLSLSDVCVCVCLRLRYHQRLDGLERWVRRLHNLQAVTSSKWCAIRRAEPDTTRCVCEKKKAVSLGGNERKGVIPRGSERERVCV
jgi:hypothetical protein